MLLRYKIVLVLLFIPAGTLNYWNAWLLIGVLFIPMLIVKGSSRKEFTRILIDKFEFVEESMIREVNKADFDGLMKLYMQLHNNHISEKTPEIMEL